MSEFNGTTHDKEENVDYHELNAQVKLMGEDGKLQLHKDKEAARAFFLHHVNENTVFFHDLEEKLDYLFKNDYYEKELFDKYDFDFVKSLYKKAYAYKFRFPSFMGAFKYYTSYTLKTFDGKRYLERYEDRVVVVALYLADGDEDAAEHLLDEMMGGRFQPATPTFLNAGKKQRGEMVSCFEGDTPISTPHGEITISNIVEGDSVYTHDGSVQKVTGVMSREESDGIVSLTVIGQKEKFSSTKEHPVLVYRKNSSQDTLIDGDGSTENVKWIAAGEVLPGDFIALSVPRRSSESVSELKISDYVKTPSTWGRTLDVDVENDLVYIGSIDKKNNKKKGSNVLKNSYSLKNTISVNEDFGRLVGYYISEGYAHYTNGVNKGIRFTFGSKEDIFIKDTVNLIERIFGFTPTVRENVDGSTNVAAWSQIMGEFFVSLIGTGFNKKRLNTLLLDASDEFLKGMLVGCFRGDGTVLDRSAEVSLSNPEIISQLRTAALRIGLLPYERTFFSASGSPTSTLKIPAISENNVDFIKYIDKNADRFDGVLASDQFRFARIIDGYVMYKVKASSFEEKTTTVYNLEVENNHTYVARGYIAHNCFLLRTEDNLESIARNITNALQLSKRGGGVALNLTNVREQGAPIKNIEGQSSGIIPVMKLLEDSFSYANQLGARQGAGAVYLNAHHPDIMRFLDTKRENADEKIRIKTLSIGIVIPDITFELAKRNDDMYLFSPYDVEKFYGKPFSDIDITEEYYDMVDNPKIRKQKIKARSLFQTIAELQFESGYPYLMFEDNVNAQSQLDGKVTHSNLCVTAETQLLTDSGNVRAGDLFESQNSFNVIVDERARTMDLDADGVASVTSTKMFKTAENTPVFKMSTIEGYELRATEYHKIYVERKDENDDPILVKIPLGEVKPGDKVLIQPSEGAYGHVHKPDLAFIAGFIAGEGSLVEDKDSKYSPSARLTIKPKNKSEISKINKIVENIFYSDDAIGLVDESTRIPTFTESEKYNKWTLSSTILAEILKNNDFTKDNKEIVPDFVLRGDRSTQVGYLSGLYQADGCITGTSKSATIELTSTNRELLLEVQRMLLNMNVFTRLYLSRKAGKDTLPDSKGGEKEYDVAEVWNLKASAQAEVVALYELLNWTDRQQKAWQEKSLVWDKNRTPYSTHRYKAVVRDIVPDGVEDVYDVTVEDGHSIIFNGIVTGNCSEILQVSTPSTFNEDGNYDHVGRDISCNLASLNVANMFDSPDFGQSVETAVRALTVVSELSNISSAPSIERGNQLSHAIGLGAMNLHGFFAREHIYYASEEAVDFTNLYFMSVRYYAMKASNKMAKEKGKTFFEFEKSKYATGEFFDMYTNGQYSEVKTEKVKELLKKTSMHVPTAEDWKQLKEDVMRDGLYNAYLIAVAPTGSISYISYSTSSIHPVAQNIEARKEGKIGRVFYPQPYLSEETLPYYADAYKVGTEAIIDVYAAATPHIDQGASLTLFVTDEATTRDLNKAYIYAWRKGIKTIYYVRVRPSTLAGTEVEDANSYCESCQV